MTYLDINQSIAAEFFTAPHEGEVIMLNLLRFREAADYTDSPQLAPESEISGREAYKRYIAHTTPFLKEIGSEMLMLAHTDSFLIGPPDEKWDIFMLISHQSAEAFLSFASNQAYLAGIGHRTAALADSRLLPLKASNSLDLT